MVLIEAEPTTKQDLTLVLSKYGPVEQRIHSELSGRGFRVGVLNTMESEVRHSPGKAVLLLDDVFEAFIISNLFSETLNPYDAYAMAVNRVLLFRELSELGYPTPDVSVALNPNVVGRVISSVGKTYMATPSASLGLDGIVTTWEGGKSVAEHRMYMANPLARINMLMKAPSKIINVQVIGNNCIGCGDLGTWVLRLSRSIKCLMCTYIIGIYEDEQVILGVDPRVELTTSIVEPMVNAIMGWYNGEG
ncbi:hypothetical protein [Vulcanisaeta souniana]|uniref:Uncharacterized protein n=1 Tax=Vulcanisaeta souniana JCM 11219 TaxID=1293586 RepID=A0A830E6H6_9CREN|nr:hypothetical protein [Vulcanisaeta souniana]BDR92334.1 hypothetical protein Vsou_14270 [Vulcanisaeta souniana JCM 11219]GGI74784.1 hypothetical protein GCM10007112_09450 [Vulcanisaeta souniana JCM 11219]